jgi:hypothetical protein
MKESFKQKAREVLGNKTYLEPMFTSCYDIPRRVYDYDNSFFVVFNHNTKKYEIHCVDYPEGNTKSMTIPFPTLDVRTLYHLWENDIRVHGKDIFRRIEEGEERARKRQEREHKNHVESFAREFQSEFAKSAWTM